MIQLFQRYSMCVLSRFLYSKTLSSLPFSLGHSPLFSSFKSNVNPSSSNSILTAKLDIVLAVIVLFHCMDTCLYLCVCVWERGLGGGGEHGVRGNGEGGKEGQR